MNFRDIRRTSEMSSMRTYTPMNWSSAKNIKKPVSEVAYGNNKKLKYQKKGIKKYGNISHELYKYKCRKWKKCYCKC